jgi:hypothetical protein
LDQISPAIRDAKSSLGRFDSRVSTRPRVTLRLEIDPASEPITGTLAGAPGRPIEFSGWLGFAAAIEQALGPARRADSGALPVPQPSEVSSSPEAVPRADESSSREWMPSFE